MPMYGFRRCVERYREHYEVKSISCLDQYLCMVLAHPQNLRRLDATLPSRPVLANSLHKLSHSHLL